ncbi:MAG TPA: type II toxin-antitoxin system VapC family toxin [Coleofasciculaceae cyanobacterium]|jgi:PIN domain nuclease of toxin-antitoxin system
MNALLDTHTFIWYIEGNLQLSKNARDIIESLDNKLHISIASLWEIAIKMGKGKLALQNPFHDLEDVLKQIDIEILPITFSDTEFYLNLPLHHNDPFDRMLIAQASHHSLVIVSADATFDAYSVQRVWA